MDTIHTGENEDRKLIKMANQANTMLLCLHIYLLLMFVLIFFVDFFLKFVFQTEARLVEAAGKDALTHMNNRRSMQEMMRQLTSDGERQVAFPKG